MRCGFGRWVWLVVWVCAGATGARPAAAEVRAGVGRAEITPPVGTPLGGYEKRGGKPSTGSHDPLYAKALVLDDGATRVAIVTTDLVGTNPKIKQQVAARTHFPPENLLLCASHTHSGPGAYAQGLFATISLGSYNPRVFALLVDRISASLDEAQKNLAPARFGVAARDLPGYGRNRRKGSRLTDPQLTVIRVDRADGQPLAALVHYTAHGTVLGEDNFLASADWMGYTQATVEKAVPGLLALYANGDEGDQSPAGHDDQRGFDRAASIGNAVGDAAVALYRQIQTAAHLTIHVASEELALPDTLTSHLLGAGKLTFLQAVGLNDTLLIAVPGELIAELGLQLKDHARAAGWKVPVIVGLANDHLGYFLTEAEFRKGGYEARTSFFGEKFGDQLTAALEKLIDRLKPTS